MTHTPTPLRIVESGSGIDLMCSRGNVCHMTAGYGQTQLQDAQFIVKACNAHDELVAALAETMRVLRHLRDSRPDQYDALVNGSSDYCNMWDRNKQALTNAEKGV